VQEKLQKTHTILVIDDDPDILRLLENILVPEGYRVVLVADVGSVSALIRDTRPDLILLDIIMPGSDGFMVLDSIRECSDVPVIMVTAKRDIESLHKTLDLGADDYIIKPFRPVELLARVRAKLRRVRLGAGRDSRQGDGHG